MTRKSHYIRITAVCLAVCLLFSAAGCKGPVQPTESTSEPTQPPQKVLHTVNVTTNEGSPLENIGVYVYTDATKSELVTFAKTDASGSITFNDVASDRYIAVLSGLPEGCQAEDSYPLTSTQTNIVLTVVKAPEVDVVNDVYALGDTISDFSVTAADGTEYKLSELLKQKKAVVLNFWFINCQPCRNEFPYLQAAYERFGSEIEVLALNPVDGDEETVEQFRTELGLTFPMMSCDPGWEKMMRISGYPTTVVIDRNGMISLCHTGTITESGVFEDIFTHFTADDYESHVVQNVEDILSGSNADTPIEVGGVTSFEVTVKPGRMAYYNIYKVTNMYLQIRSGDAYAVYDGYTYTPINGVVGFTVTTPDTYTPASVAFGNSGTKEITYTVTLSAYPGTNDNPYTMELGQFEVRVSQGNDQGVYYEYYAQEEGVLTVRCLEVNRDIDYDFALYNTDTSAYRTLAGDSDGDNAVTINAYEGDYIRIVISTLPDSSNVYPAGVFTFEASFEAGEIKEEEKKEIVDYAVTVTDEKRNPVPGVYLYVEVDGEAKALVTNDQGIAHTKLELGTYKVTLALPKGYTAASTQFRFTEVRRTFSVKLDTQPVEMEIYTVNAVDTAGSPVANVLVSVGNRFGYTDENGNVSMEVEKDLYTAVIDTPEGWTADTKAYPFGENENTLTVTLQAGTEVPDPEDGKVTYTVTTLDYSGAVKTGLAVQFLKDGVPVAVKAADPEGKAAARLEPGEYTFMPVSQGAVLNYEGETLILTAEAPDASVQITEGVSGEPEVLYVGNAYYVNQGGTYVELQPGIVNYFLFEPTEPGLYQFASSDPNAPISYWGGSTVSLIIDQTSGTDYDPAANAFTVNVKASNIGMTCILGITGEGGCVLQVTRLGEPVLDETDIVPEVYEGKTVPTAPYSVTGVSGKKLTYVDLTAPSGTVNAVFNEADGYYHLNSADGPLLYVNLSSSAPHISMYVMLGLTGVGGTNFTQTFYDEAGNAVRREDYTVCMQAYASNTDSKYGVYPLTEDLVYMLQQGGARKGWWDPENGNYLFSEVTDMNPENGWMFAVCYFA